MDRWDRPFRSCFSAGRRAVVPVVTVAVAVGALVSTCAAPSATRSATLPATPRATVETLPHPTGTFASGVPSTPNLSTPPAVAPTVSTSSAPTVVPPSPRPVGRVPTLQPLLHQAGAYVTEAGSEAGLTGAGLFLGLPTQSGAESPTPPAGLRYIDRSLEVILYHHLKNDGMMLKLVRRRLAALRNNPHVVAFYVLDDYPGNVSKQLRQIHALVAQANETSAVPRSTVCAFIAPVSASITGISEFRQAISNYSNQACDAVAFYSYSGAGDTKLDWGMHASLPLYKRMLEASPYDWNIKTHPLIGIPQAFGTGMRAAPRPGQLTEQIEGFCRDGASSILGFTWDRLPETRIQPAIVDTLGTDHAMRQAFLRGVEACRSGWDRAEISTARR